MLEGTGRESGCEGYQVDSLYVKAGLPCHWDLAVSNVTAVPGGSSAQF